MMVVFPHFFGPPNPPIIAPNGSLIGTAFDFIGAFAALTGVFVAVTFEAGFAAGFAAYFAAGFAAEAIGLLLLLVLF